MTIKYLKAGKQRAHQEGQMSYTNYHQKQVPIDRNKI
jgi:hypothetical protein